MSKRKALIIVTISVEPHNPVDKVEFEVAHAGRDTEEILAALVCEKFRELRKPEPRSDLVPSKSTPKKCRVPRVMGNT